MALYTKTEGVLIDLEGSVRALADQELMTTTMASKLPRCSIFNRVFFFQCLQMCEQCL